MSVRRFDAVPARALAVFAHPDDADVACGGTLAAWASRGCDTHLIVVTQGDKGSQDPDADVAALVARRAKEVERAAEVLGVSGVEHLGYRDGEVENDPALRAHLVQRMRTLRPDVVIAPDPTAVFFGSTYVNHRDHRTVGWAVLDAVSPASASPLYFPEAGAPHAVSTLLLSGSLDPDVLVDVEDHLDVKARAVLCHESQVGGAEDVMRDVLTQRAADAARGAAVRHAEAFRLVTLG